MDPRGLRVTQTTYFSLLTHAKQLSLVILCDTTAGIGKNGSVTYTCTYRMTYRHEARNNYLDAVKRKS